MVKCYDCGKSFFNEKYYEAHVKRRHSIDDTKIQENFSKIQNESSLKNQNVINDEELNTKVKDMTNELLGELIKREAGLLEENKITKQEYDIMS